MRAPHRRLARRHPTLVSAALAATSLAAATLLTGCSGDADQDPASRPAPEALEEAVAAFVAADTGVFTFQVGDDATRLIRTTGTFALDAGAFDWSMTLSDGDRSSTVDQRRVGDRAWLRLGRDGEAPRGCWQPVSPGRAEARTGTRFDPPQSGATPHPDLAPAAVVTTAEGGEWVDEGTVLRATSDLAAVAATLGDVVSDLDLGSETLAAGAEVTFLLTDGEVTAWRTDLVAVLEALSDAGVELTRDLRELVATGVELTVAAGFSDLGRAEVSAPAAGEVCPAD